MRYRFIRFPGGKPKVVTLSYDDGCRADIKLSEILSKYNMKCTFNINSEYIAETDTGWYLTSKEIKEHIIDKGHEIAVHGARHRANGNIKPIEGIQDVLNCRLTLEKEFGVIVRGMAYPDSGIRHFHNNVTYSDITSYLKSLDIAYARTISKANDSFYYPEDWYRWIPTAHHYDAEVFDLIEKFTSFKLEDTYLACKLPKVFYLWGHSYEFDKRDDWGRMEEICQKLGNKDDTWYATNMEIYEYVQAYHSLVFSADSKIIYNPTLKKIWFDIDDVPYSIEPGETLKID